MTSQLLTTTSSAGTTWGGDIGIRTIDFGKFAGGVGDDVARLPDLGTLVVDPLHYRPQRQQNAATITELDREPLPPRQIRFSNIVASGTIAMSVPQQLAAPLASASSAKGYVSIASVVKGGGAVVLVTSLLALAGNLVAGVTIIHPLLGVLAALGGAGFLGMGLVDEK